MKGPPFPRDAQSRGQSRSYKDTPTPALSDTQQAYARTYSTAEEAALLMDDCHILHCLFSAVLTRLQNFDYEMADRHCVQSRHPYE
jgi:hypothetical protein